MRLTIELNIDVDAFGIAAIATDIKGDMKKDRQYMSGEQWTFFLSSKTDSAAGITNLM